MVKLKKSDFNIFVKIISKDNINNFHLLNDNQIRKLREPKVKKIMKAMKDGVNFDAPIVIIKNGNLTVLDGQHRIVAIRRMINIDETFKIEVVLFEYESQTAEEQGKLFGNWNCSTTQSTDDFIQMFSTTIPFWNILKQEHFTQNVNPISIYPMSDEVHFRKWVGSYISAIKSVNSGVQGTQDEFLKSARKLNTENDYNIFFDMCVDIKKNIPAIFQRGYRYATTTGIASLIYNYYKIVSMGKMSKINFWKSYNKNVATSEDYYDACQHPGYGPTATATKLLTELINKV